MKKTRSRRVVITGVGVVAPNAVGADSFWDSLEKGRSGIKRISLFDASKFRCQVGGEISDFEPSKFIDPTKLDRMDRYAQLAVAATKMALQDSGLPADAVAQSGIYIGSGLGGMLCYERNFEALHNSGPRSIHPNAVPGSMPNSVNGHIAMEFGIKGPSITVSTACSSSSHAIGLALDAIRLGRAKVVVAGGAEASLSPLTFGAFDALRVMAADCNAEPGRACRPFDRDRKGLVLAEGAAIVILEDREEALARQAKIYAELVGYAGNAGAYHIVAPDPSGQDVTLAIRQALAYSGVAAHEIDFVSAHGTGTQANDRVEAAALKQVFGSHMADMHVNSAKSMIGHTIGASGAFGVLSALLAIRKGIIHPTINITTPDPECGIDVTPNSARKATVKTAMVDSFGFGSNNAILILREDRNGDE